MEKVQAALASFMLTDFTLSNAEPDSQVGLRHICSAPSIDQKAQQHLLLLRVDGLSHWARRNPGLNHQGSIRLVPIRLFSDYRRFVEHPHRHELAQARSAPSRSHLRDSKPCIAMKRLTLLPRPVVNWIECDRCKIEAESGDILFDSIISIEYHAGYTSPFGDGSVVQLDICEDCFKDLLLTWIRVKRTAT